jgi:4'-phosphopantetheinyl transferase
MRGEEFRNRWVRSRVALRRIIATHCKLEPADIRFEYGPFGKPRLPAANRKGPPVHFNMTRSGNMCLIAICHDRPIGIDVEQLAPHGAVDRIARQLFTPEETVAIERLVGLARERAFLNVWTRKEAYLKAVGLGLQRSARSFQVSSEDGTGTMISIDGDTPSAWRLVPLAPESDFVGTLAVRDGRRAPQRDIRFHSFSLDETPLIEKRPLMVVTTKDRVWSRNEMI